MSRASLLTRVLGVALIAWTGCAQVGSPDGGSRDAEPPQVVASNPDFGARRVEASALRLVFDEFVQLQDARRQILVSPPLATPPKARVRGRELLLEWEGPLLADRTYVVQFGNAVRDLRESNVAAGLTHVFSTGAVLDSGRVAGEVLDAWSGQPAAGVRVLLFRDSLPQAALDVLAPDSLRPLPDYVGMVDDSGRFDIGFLPDGRFSALAVDDVNGNYRLDAGEAVAWSDVRQPSLPVDSTSVMRLKLDPPPPEVASYLSGMRLDSSGDWRARWVGWEDLASGPDGWRIGELALALVGPDTAVVPQQSGDSLWAEWPGSVDLAELEGQVWRFVHPFGTDTLRFTAIAPAGVSKPVGPAPREVDAKAGLRQRLAPVPDQLDAVKCSGQVILDEDTMALDPAILRVEAGYLKAAPLTPGGRYALELLPGALMRQGLAASDTVRLTWTVRGDDATGSLVLALDSADVRGLASLVFVLTDGDGRPLYDRRPDAAGRFSDLPPGRYGLVAIEDRDGNGRWTGVDPSIGRMPEPVVIVATGVEVRAGWELELTGTGLPRP